MGFVNAVHPLVPAPGFVSAPGWMTIVQTTRSQHEARIQEASQDRKRCLAVYSNRSAADMAGVRAFFNARRGARDSFPFPDLNDSSTASDLIGTVSATDVVLETIANGSADGTATQFQLRKIYEPSGAAPYAKKITLPVTSSVVIAKDGTPFAAGGNWSVSATTGVVTFNVAPANGVVVTAGFQHYTPMRYAEETEKAAQFKRDFWEANEVTLGFIETLDETEWPDLAPSGGALVLDLSTTDAMIDPSQAWGYVEGQVAARTAIVYLPPPRGIPGGVIFDKVRVTGSSGTLTIKDHEGTTLAGTLAVGTVRTVCLVNDGTTATWVITA